MMYPFYILFVLFVTAGFIAGYRAGFIKSILVVFVTAAALCCGCFFYMPLAAEISNRWEADTGATRLVCFVSLFFLTALLLLFIVNRLGLFSRSNNKITGKIAGAVLTTALAAAVCTIVPLLTGNIEMPTALAGKLEETGITGMVESGAAAAGNLFAAEDNTGNEKLPVLNNGTGESEESIHISFTQSANYRANPAFEKEMLQLVNAERRKAGLPALVYDSALTMVARKHTADMLLRGYFSHNTPEGLTPFQRLHSAKIFYRFAGENLAFASTVLKAHEGLMLSPGHRANILNRRYKKAGIAVMENGFNGLMVAEEFKD